MSFIAELVTIGGGSVALVGAAAVLAKQLTTQWLTRDLDGYRLMLTLQTEEKKKALQEELESHKAQLARQNSEALDEAKFIFEQELIKRRGEVEIAKEMQKQANESQKQFLDRIRSQVQRWALPITGATRDLRTRLTDILKNDGDVMLDPNSAPVEGWSVNYEYQMSSTIYYFAQFFFWTRSMQQQLGHELFESATDMTRFFGLIDEISTQLSQFPLDQQNGDSSEVTDAQVFKLQQRALGEILVDKSGSTDRVMTYREFVDSWLDVSNTSFKRHATPMERFLSGIRPTADLRWTRLTVLLERLVTFQEVCESVLAPVGEQLAIPMDDA